MGEPPSLPLARPLAPQDPPALLALPFAPVSLPLLALLCRRRGRGPRWAAVLPLLLPLPLLLQLTMGTGTLLL